MIAQERAQHLRILFVILALSIIFYGTVYRDKVMPGVYLGNIDVSGKSRAELVQLLNQEIEEFKSNKIRLLVDIGNDQKELQLDLDQLGITYDLDKTSKELFAAGRSGSIGRNFLFRIMSPLVKTKVKPVYWLNAPLFASNLDSVLANYIKPTHDATIVYEGSSFNIKREEPGKTYDRELLVSNIRDMVEHFSQEAIIVNFVETAPDVRAQNANLALEKVKTLANQKIVLAHDRDRWSLSGNRLLDILDFKPKGRESEDFSANLGSGLIIVRTFNQADSLPELEVTLNGETLGQFVDEIGNSIDVETVNASLVFEGGRASQFTPARDGLKLDRETTRKLLLAKVSVDSVSGESEILINLPVAVTRAKIASDEINSLGIKELIGKGVSYFAGSIANRVHNLTLGSQRISGTIVPPGEIFSFNNSVGDISGASGYRPAYVISSGRTVLDDGGGICQVSTTVFRAALNAGLPIVSRTAHAYRVGYYEQRGFKAGLDATVWAPAVDLAFKNDTDRHILVQAVVDRAGGKLQVDIYGTGDGRRVELSEPVISNIKPAPEPRYQADPTLPKGTIKQVDFAAAGATSVFTRKVYKGNQLIIDDAFKSNFRPWQAVYLVGTGG